MTPSLEALDAIVESSAKLLGIELEPEWIAAVRLNLAVSYRLAGLVDEVVLPEDAEPAPVFEA